MGKQLNTTIIAFTGATRLKSCVRTHCFYLFDICRVEFIWGNITFLSYIDGSVKERCNSSALAMELRLSCTNPSKYSPQNTKSRLNTFNCWWPGATGSQCFSRYLKYHIFSDFFSLGNGNITLLVCDLNRTPNCYGKTWRFLCPFFRNLHLRENLARDCFTSTVSTVTNSVQNIFTHLRNCDK